MKRDVHVGDRDRRPAAAPPSWPKVFICAPDGATCPKCGAVESDGVVGTSGMIRLVPRGREQFFGIEARLIEGVMAVLVGDHAGAARVLAEVAYDAGPPGAAPRPAPPLTLLSCRCGATWEIDQSRVEPASERPDPSCWNCEGRGYVGLEDDEEGTERGDCPDCQGTGQHLGPCPDCNGTGAVAGQREPWCSKCDGTGEAPDGGLGRLRPAAANTDAEGGRS